jgi:hypothetical protein
MQMSFSLCIAFAAVHARAGKLEEVLKQIEAPSRVEESVKR